MTNTRTILKAATRWTIVLVTSVVLLAPNLFAAKVITKASGPKSCCHRCACCIGKSSDQPQVPLAPSSTRTSVDQTGLLLLPVIAIVLFESASRVVSLGKASDPHFSTSAPIFLRHCAILI